MIVTRTFVEKGNTIIENKKENFGLNPIFELYYGNLKSRCLLYFNHEKVKSLIEDKTYPDMSKLRHALKMRNMGSYAGDKVNKPFPDITVEFNRKRAASFDLYFFLIPKEWDEGRGFFPNYDLHPQYGVAYNTDGSNWYNNKTGYNWDYPGIYTTQQFYDAIEGEVQDDKLPKIIGKHHFDFGNEDLNLDITDVFNKFISGELENYGIGILFDPLLEIIQLKDSKYVGFFSNHTNGFYVPYIETRYEDYLRDDRVNFYLDKNNRLYFYSNVGGNFVNLDEIPTCTIDNVQYDVKQATKGVYYIDILLNSSNVDEDVMIFDKWGNIKYQGKVFDDVELYFTTKRGFFNFGLSYETKKQEDIVPYVYGINENDSVSQGELRKINVDCKVKYTKNVTHPFDALEYRLYVKDGNNEYDVISWTPVDIGYNENFFMINTAELLPEKYFVDIRVKYNNTETLHKNMLSFKIRNNITEYYN